MRSPPERSGDAPSQSGGWGHAPIAGTGYGRYATIVGVVVVAVVLAISFANPGHGASGLAPGTQVPPFAAPLAFKGPKGIVDIAVHADEGQRGRVPACREQGTGILNICELYERGPVVLALYVQSGSCPDVLRSMQTLSRFYPHVGFAAVAIRASRAEVRSLVRREALSIPVGVDEEGSLAALYRMASCPQVSFISPHGRVQSRALLTTPSRQVLTRRVAALVVASRARGWKPT